MPAVNPRISVTLRPSLDAVLRRLSEVSGQSRSSFIAEMLEQSEPVFERMAVILETARNATEEAKSRMASNLDEAHERLLEHAGLIGDLFEDHIVDLVGDVEGIARRKVGGARPRGGRKHEHGTGPRTTLGRAMAEATAPLVTRGSGTPVPTPKKPGKVAAKPSVSRVKRKKGGD